MASPAPQSSAEKAVVANHRTVLQLFAGACLALAAGCRLTTPLAPQAGAPPSVAAVAARPNPANHEFYPLDPGSRWHYRASLLRRVHHPDGTIEVVTDDHFELATELTCSDTSGGHKWQVERRFESFANGTSATAWNMYRQDRDGLWGAAAGAIDPCAQGLPAGTVGDRQLAYPLRPGASWVVREGFFPIVATVEAQDVLDLPIGRVTAWRVRLDRPGIYEPGHDYSLAWYGRTGFLQSVTHLEDSVLVRGGLLGVLEAEMRQTLDDVQLASPGRFAPDGALAQRRTGATDPR